MGLGDPAEGPTEPPCDKHCWMPGTGLVTLGPQGDYETSLLSGNAGIAAQFRVAVKHVQYNAAVKNTGFGIRLSRI